RADTVAVIGSALVGKAGGHGHRVIAARLGRPASTVRGWLRRFAARAEPARAAFTALAGTLVVDAVLPGPVGSGVAGAVAAGGAAAAGCARRFCRALGAGRGVAGGGVGGRGQRGSAVGPGLAGWILQHELALGSRVVIGKPRRSAISAVDNRGNEVSSTNEQARRTERAQRVAYWRYQLIRDAAD